MDFTESDEEIEFRNYIQSVFDEKIKPRFPEWKSANTTPKEMFKLLGDSGLLGFFIEEDEVKQIPWLKNIHYYKYAGIYDGGLAIASFAHSQLALQALFNNVNSEQKKTFLMPGVRGEKIFAFANTEPGAGSDAAAIKLHAEEKDDHFIINGSKSYITNGDIADHIVVTAVTHPEVEKKHAGISMFIVDGDHQGLSRHRLDKYPWKISHLSVLHFKDVSVPKENLLGEMQRGFYQTMDVFNASRIGLSALTFGTALGSYRLAHRHAVNRKAFGKTLIQNDSKKNEFADNLVRLEASWLLTQKAAFLKDSGREFRYNSSMAKLFTTEEALKITEWATEILGARGVLERHPVSDYHHDAKGSMMGEGAPEVQKRIISRIVQDKVDEY